MLKLAVRDMNNCPPLSAMDNVVTENSHVTSSFSNNDHVDLCVVGGTTLENLVHLFVHPVGLEGKAGSVVEMDSLFDDRVMVNSICKDKFALKKDALEKFTTSEKSLCMVDGTIVPSYRCWSGGVTLGGRTVKVTFKIFPSRGSWSLLFGKPLLQAFKAIHN